MYKSYCWGMIPHPRPWLKRTVYQRTIISGYSVTSDFGVFFSYFREVTTHHSRNILTLHEVLNCQKMVLWLLWKQRQKFIPLGVIPRS